MIDVDAQICKETNIIAKDDEYFAAKVVVILLVKLVIFVVNFLG